MVVDCSLFREHPRLTAARECYEETLGILGTSEELATALSDFKTNNCFKVVSTLTSHAERILICHCAVPSIHTQSRASIAYLQSIQILNVDTQYVEHFMRITYSDYPNIFETVLMSTDEVHIEVDVMK